MITALSYCDVVNSRPKRQSLVTILFAACVWGGIQRSAQCSPILDKPAPALVVTQLNGATFDLSKLRGKVVLVNYWATWCGPCKKEMPILNRFYQAHHAKGLEILGISADRSQDYEKMRSMSKALSYPTAIANQIANDGFGPPEGFPLTYLVDAQGVVRDKFIDAREDLLKDVVMPLLTQPRSSR